MIVPVDTNYKTQRDTKWICVCPICQNERVVSYSQKWNIETGKNNKECRNCQVETGMLVYDTKGLELGRKYNGKLGKNKSTKLNELLQYRNLFQNPSYELEVKEKQRNSKLGKFGEFANAYTTGSSKERNLLMGRDEYKQLRKNVFDRDDYTCQLCFIRGGYIEMDHIKEWRNYPEYRYDMNNCRTLCKSCHKNTDNYGHKAKRLKRDVL